ncbi:ribonuclease III, partial [Clavulina sp. PMI_390]
ACHIIVRFDPLQTFVGYVQSRGRARRADSEYIVMISEDGQDELRLYNDYKQTEPGLKKRYQTEVDEPPPGITLDDEDGIDDELTNNEIYEIPSTGAKLTSYASIPLLMYLCTLIPHDGFSPQLAPKFQLINSSEGIYRCTVTLPSALPLEGSDRVFAGPLRRGKRSAKSSAAFMVMRRLIDLKVFDDHLLPGRLERGDDALDADGRGIVSVADLEPIIHIDSVDPFGSLPSGETATSWMHPIFLDGIAATALIMAEEIRVPLDADFPLIGGTTKRVVLGKGTPCIWGDDEGKKTGFALLDQFFTKLLSMTTTGEKLDSGLTPYYLAPLDTRGEIDWGMVQDVINLPISRRRPGPESEHVTLIPGLLVELFGIMGRVYQVIRVRNDLTPMSQPDENSPMAGFPTYQQYWEEKRRQVVSPDETLVEVRSLKKHQAVSTTLSRISDLSEHLPTKDMVEHLDIVPYSFCCPLPVPFDFFEVFRTLPSIIHHIVDIYRATLVHSQLKLPPLAQIRLVEALTIPSSGMGYSFQRLETLGDAVLKAITAVHVYNKFPHRHEGQLDIARSNSVNNNYLLGRAREAGLQHFLIHEATKPRWRPGSNVRFMNDQWMTVENLSYLEGGVNTALQTGTILGLCTGGPEPWASRGYEIGAPDGQNEHSQLLQPLEEKLQYRFHNSRLLLQALCHPTFRHETVSSYQRLEFLGDAVSLHIIDLYVTQYLFLKYPEASPGQITWAKSRSVCNPCLGTVSARALSLQQNMLANSPALETAIAEYLDVVKDVPYAELVVKTWAFDPPKPMADLLEA